MSTHGLGPLADVRVPQILARILAVIAEGFATVETEHQFTLDLQRTVVEHDPGKRQVLLDGSSHRRTTHDEGTVADQRQCRAIAQRDACPDDPRGAPAHAVKKAVMRDVARGSLVKRRGKAKQMSRVKKNGNF